MTKKKLWIVVTAVCLCLAIVLVACGRKPQGETPIVTDPAETDGPVATAPASGTYTVELLSEGGMPLEGVGVYVYKDDTLADLVWFARTDASGIISFTGEAGNSAVAVLENVPNGYQVDASYPLTGETTQIVLVSAMLSEDELEGVSLSLGDMMYDIAVTTADGTEYKLSELLEEKDAVVLNFWYLECQPCRAEFPYLQEAYEAYSDKIEILALNPINTDEAAIAAFQEEFGLTFPVAACNPKWQEALGMTAYPTTVVIDRYGTISMIHTGSIPDADMFKTIFEYFVSEDYQQGEAEDLDTILEEAEDLAYQMSIGTADNPDEFSGVSSRKITVPAGEKYYCNMYKVSKLYLTINDPDAYVIYNGKTYKANGGSVSLTLTADDTRTSVQLIIGNSGEELKEFTMKFGMPSGTQSNPYSMKLGTFTVKAAAGNNQGVYYTYKCKQSGTIVARCLSATSGVKYDLTLYNLSTYALRNLQGDALVDDEGYRVVTMKVNKGDTLQFSAGALPDGSGNYPAVKLKVDVNYTTDENLLQPEQEQVETTTYAVTVTDENRQGIPGVQVYLVAENVTSDENTSEETTTEETTGEETTGETTVTTTQLTTDENGVAAGKLVPGNYSVVLKLPAGYDAKTKEFKLSAENPMASIKADKVEMGDRPHKDLVNVGIAYYVEQGENQLELAHSELTEIYNYFIFEPTETGLYQVTTLEENAKVSNWATSNYPYNASSDMVNNSFEINVKELIDGLGYVVGVSGAENCTLVITRIGDPKWDVSDEPWSEDWKEGLSEPPTKKFKLSSGGKKLTYVDLESTAKVVFNSADGYYHLNSKNGPVIYVNLGANAPYISMYDMLGYSGNGGGAQNLTRYFYDEEGNFIKKEMYTDWMRPYIENRDATYDVYPLTDTLMYMLQNGGEQFGWWDSESSVYKFSDIDLNEEIAWMFACCYIPK